MRKAVALTYLVGVALGGVAIAMTQVPSARLIGVAVLLALAALAAVPLYRVPVYRVPWGQAKGRKLTSLPDEAGGPGQAGKGGPGNAALQRPQPPPRTPAKA